MRRTFVLSSGLLLVGLGSWVIAQENLPQTDSSAVPQDTEIARQYSYSIGLDIGSSFKSDGVQLDVESLLAGLQDGLKAADPKFDPRTCEQAMQKLGRIRMEAHKQKNQAYLETNRQAEGVQVLPSGLQYKVLKPGNGPSPAPTDTVRTHYSGRLIDGTVFDSSYQRDEPFTTRLDQVIPGWTEALQNMKVGEKWLIVVPSDSDPADNKSTRVDRLPACAHQAAVLDASAWRVFAKPVEPGRRY